MVFKKKKKLRKLWKEAYYVDFLFYLAKWMVSDIHQRISKKKIVQASSKHQLGRALFNGVLFDHCFFRMVSGMRHTLRYNGYDSWELRMYSKLPFFLLDYNIEKLQLLFFLAYPIGR